MMEAGQKTRKRCEKLPFWKDIRWTESGTSVGIKIALAAFGILALELAALYCIFRTRTKYKGWHPCLRN